MKCSLSLDSYFFQRPTCAEVLALKGSEPWFDTDEYLVPVLENDPFIRELFFPLADHTRQLGYSVTGLIDTDSTDSEDEDPDITDPDKRIKILERKLVRAQQGFIDYQALVVEKLDQTRDSHKIQEDPRSTRDDDTHYFESYEAHGTRPLTKEQYALTHKFPNRYTRHDDTR